MRKLKLFEEFKMFNLQREVQFQELNVCQFYTSISRALYTEKIS